MNNQQHPQHPQQHHPQQQQLPITELLSPLEQTLLHAIELCNKNSTMLDSWQVRDQTQLWAQIDDYVADLGKIHGYAERIPLQYTTQRQTLLYVYYYLFFGFVGFCQQHCFFMLNSTSWSQFTIWYILILRLK